MAILDTVSKEMNRALKNEVEDITFVQVDESLDVATGVVTETTNEFACKGHDQEVSEKFLDNTEVDLSNREFIILQESLTDNNGNQIEPDTDDKVKINGTTFGIVMVGEDPSSSIWQIVGRS